MHIILILAITVVLYYILTWPERGALRLERRRLARCAKMKPYQVDPDMALLRQMEWNGAPPEALYAQARKVLGLRP